MKKPFSSVIDKNDFEYEHMLYYCPEEVILALQGKPASANKEGQEIYFWFVCFADGDCRIVSKLVFFAAMYRALMRGKIESVNHQIKLEADSPAIGYIKSYLAKREKHENTPGR